MFPMLRGVGASLARALCQFALDRNADAFEEIRPPTLVRSATLQASGQLPKFADEAYQIERDDLWAIPTAEVPLTSIRAGQVIEEAELPVRYMAYTPCFRREAGSAGRDTRGLLRVHEFDKVEILSLCTRAQAADMHAELLARASGSIAALACPTGSSTSAPAISASPCPLFRYRGVRAGLRPVVGGVVGVVVFRLPGPPRRHPLPPGGWRGQRRRRHSQRFCASRAASVGGPGGDLPPT